MTLKTGIKAVVAIGLTLAVGACDYVPGTEAYRFRKAKERVSQIFIDSESAQFKFIWMGKDGKTVCGKVTARNQFGGFSDYQRFFAPPLDNGDFLAFIEGDPNPEAFYHFEKRWYDTCETSMTKEAVDDMLRFLEENK